MQRILKYGDIRIINLTPNRTEHFDLLTAFLHHHIQELYTFKNARFLLGHPVGPVHEYMATLSLDDSSLQAYSLTQVGCVYLTVGSRLMLLYIDHMNHR